ncbi:hypothetical protein AVM11_09515 [Sphingomonas melonis TY]|jgi:hypothetical protein|uniref:Uncharacterized protein n=1 Tax=Sphingomonas melonis TY TaxID=621456 RepID=A0A175Y0H8_9SPHN|nr:hypothetical protein [Sphingomonas melonis]AOW25338.1 hypothetical protein BJP26_18805 [Sphingomonas melonis TY]KZB93886.1 hypothetical protein AVM11_09515 [Sphingomonas melonis TY]
MAGQKKAAPTMHDAMFLPDWSRSNDIRVELSTIDPARRGFCENSIWSHQFEDLNAMCDFWEFISAREHAWPFMAVMARRRGPAALSALLLRLGAPLPAVTSVPS